MQVTLSNGKGQTKLQQAVQSLQYVAVAPYV